MGLFYRAVDLEIDRKKREQEMLNTLKMRLPIGSKLFYLETSLVVVGHKVYNYSANIKVPGVELEYLDARGQIHTTAYPYEDAMALLDSEVWDTRIFGT